ncbi:LO5 [Symphysodon discus adomavirus 1]|uniref:LO5 n=1 Tax=Symphysodon discus adomavirus 1 TaxID=2175118 RepID=A0A2S1MK43_9VIRU|nr:LO5 [Symphysodon discus adomavirus 1]AWG87405.1 LO5 [Symphysodon discus adomavirus 1]
MATSRQVQSLGRTPGGMGYSFLGTFDDNDQNNYCVLDLSAHPVACERDPYGNGLAAISVTQITVSNCALHIGNHLGNHYIYVGGARVQLPDVSNTSVTQFLDYLQACNPSLSFEFKLGRLTYTGNSAVIIPVRTGIGQHAKPIPHNLTHMLGFTGLGEVEYENDMCVVITPDVLGNSAPDLFGPVRDLVVSCAEVTYNRHSRQSVAVCSPCGTPGQAYTRDCSDLVRELNIPGGYLCSLTFTLTDAADRPVRFVHGVPLICVRILPITLQ